MYELRENDQLVNYQLINKIRTAVYKIGKREEKIEELERLLKEDTKGESYKFFFGKEGQHSYWDPKGNNLLLLAISTARLVGEGNKYIATQLTDIILKNAQEKLTKREFGEFINFRYGNGDLEKYNDYGISYDNTPLTLCIKEGLPSLAIELLKLEAKINVSCGYANFSPLHLAILHYVIKPTDPLRKDLILELINKGANIATKDQYGHSAKDLLQYKGLGVEDLHLFTINTQELKQALRSEPGPKYSFKELATNKHVVDFFKDKGFTTFEPNWTNTNLFKNFLDEHRQKNGDKYIIDYNDIDERNGPKEDILSLS